MTLSFLLPLFSFASSMDSEEESEDEELEVAVVIPVLLNVGCRDCSILCHFSSLRSLFWNGGESRPVSSY